MGMGLQSAYGLANVREELKQRLLAQIAEQERQRKGGLAERDMALQERESLARAEERRTAQADTSRSRDEANAMRAVALRPIGARVTGSEYQRETGLNVPSGLYNPEGVQEPQPPESLAAEPAKMSGSLRMIPDTLANSVEPAKQAYTFTGTEDAIARQDALRARGEEAQAGRDAAAERASASQQSSADMERQRQADKQENLRLAASLRPAPDNSGKHDARTDRSYQYHRTALDKIAKPLEDQQARMGRLIETVNQGTPQSDALVAPELLTVMAGGAGSGLRMNEAEISRIIGGRSKWEDLRATLQHWSTNPKTANSITPDQRQQIRQLISAVHDKSAKSLDALNAAGDELIDAPDVNSHRQTIASVRKKLQQINEGGGATESGGTIRARDPQGRLHEAPAGTPLPSGWKVEK